MKKLLSWVAVTGLIGAAAAEPPNVIVILADDLGYADVGFHEGVADGVCTPNLDQLAAGGIVFRNAYSSSAVCSNSRLSLSTGRYAQRWGGYYYGEGGLPSNEYTIAEMMREAGYRTMKVGKTHMNNGPKAPPTQHGFEHSLGFRHHSWDSHLISSKDVDAYNAKKPGSAKNTYMAPIGPLTRDDKVKVSFENTTTTEVFGQESVRFINEESEKPFYLQLEFNAVHTPLTRPPEPLAKKYGIPKRPFDRHAAVWAYPLWDPLTQPDYKAWYDQTCHLGIADPYGRKIYLAHLESMDRAIGQVMTALEERGIADNTLIFFSSDNGGSDQSYANNGDLNAYKYCLMDGGMKVPMILSWPNRFGAHQELDATVTHRDLFASLSEITGIAPKKKLDGQSLLPLIDGLVNEIHPEPIYWDIGQNQGSWAVRQGDWKLVYRRAGKSYKAYELDANGLVKPQFRTVPIAGGMQLYNLADDPGERINRATQSPERVAAMEKLYTNWRAKMAVPVNGENTQ